MTDYDSIKALNWSSLKYIRESPLMYKWRLTHPEPPKPSYNIGLPSHCLILEPDEFRLRYDVYGEGDRWEEWLDSHLYREIPRSGKVQRRGALWQEWCDDHPGVKALSAREMDTVQHIADAVHSHPEARELLERCRHEEPLVWVDPDTGLQCKGRVDMLSVDFVGDLKTTRNIEPWRFGRDARDYMYDGQLAHYHTGAITLHKISGTKTPWIIAAQNHEPFDVVVYRMKPDDLEEGRQLGLRLQRRLQECQAADWWPGCAPGIQYLDIPPRYDDQPTDEEPF